MVGLDTVILTRLTILHHNIACFRLLPAHAIYSSAIAMYLLSIDGFGLLRFTFHEVQRSENIHFIGFHNETIHHHFIQQEMHLF